MPPLYFPPGEAAALPAAEMALEAAAEDPPPPSAFLGALEATVLAAPPSPLVRTGIFRDYREASRSKGKKVLNIP